LRHRQAAIFALIVFVPLSVAGWLALRVSQHEQALGRHQAQSLLEDRLSDVESQIGRVVGDLERDLLENVVDATPPDSDRLRKIRRNVPLVRHAFHLTKDGSLAFPPDDETTSDAERLFRERTAPIWNGDAVLYKPAGTDDQAGPGSDDLIQVAATHDHGWISWYWEEGLHLLFWRRSSSGGAVGVELDRIAVMSRVVGKLPTTEIGGGRVALVDSRGDVIHQWGPHQPDDDDRAVASVQVRYPLDAWRLEYFPSPAQGSALFHGSATLRPILAIAGVAIALILLAGFFYREYVRKLRDAAQRVDFVTQVSHELKTPLTNIRLYAELAGLQLEDHDERTERRLSVVVAECERLTRLINNILVFSRQRRGAVQLSERWVDLDGVVRSVLDQFEPALAAKDIEWTISGGVDEPVYADPDAIGQIVANLVSNVEKYGASGHRLDIETSRDEQQTAITVADRGPGIPAAHRERIFKPFHRISERLSDGATGTGIGLTIARELARSQGGDLRLRPDEHGACFQLTLANSRGEVHEGTGS
jgi:signal transduction histidine kinase